MEGKALVPVRAGVVGQADQHDGEGGGVAVLAGDGAAVSSPVDGFDLHRAPPRTG
jgi:hypothetical protein